MVDESLHPTPLNVNVDYINNLILGSLTLDPSLIKEYVITRICIPTSFSTRSRSLVFLHIASALLLAFQLCYFGTWMLPMDM